MPWPKGRSPSPEHRAKLAAAGRRQAATCSVEGCASPPRARGWCNKHWYRWRIRGDPEALLYRGPVEAFWSRVERRGPDDCWPWLGDQKNGYGRLKVEGRDVYAHRFAYELLVGPIPEGLTVDHLCGTQLCENPAHMELVTLGENTRRARAATA